MSERLDSRHFKMILEFAPAPIIIIGMEGTILFVNNAVENYFGYRRTEITHQLVSSLIPEISKTDFTKNEDLQFLMLLLNRGLDVHVRHKSGYDIPVDISLSPVVTTEEQSLITAILHIRHDVHAHEENLYNLVQRDSLTTLFTRDCFKDKLRYAINLVRNTNKILSVLYLDIDHFKNINDTYGHAIGDRVLKLFASRLKQSLRTCEVIARFSGDEFVCLITNIERESDIDVIVSRVFESISEPFFIENKSLSISASMGISLFPKDSDDPAILIEKADFAMYEAKKNGKNGFCYASESVLC